MNTITVTLAAATPTQLDAELANRSIALARAEAAVASLEKRIAKGESLVSQQLAGAKQGVEVNAEAIEALHAEYARRPWNRYFLVDGGHLHYDASNYRCSRTPSTSNYLIAELSGLTSDEAIEIAGERVCTTCFPQAPVDVTRRASTLLTPTEREQAEARQAREDKRTAVAKAKADKAITAPDGSVLKTAGGSTVHTEAEAQRVYREAVTNATLRADDEFYRRGKHQSVEEFETHRAWLIGRDNDEAVQMLEALAAKHGVDIETERAAHAKPLATKIRKDRREGIASQAAFADLYA
jgi:hypothetical protein